MSSRSLLASRHFRLLLLGQTTSQLGSQVTSLAIPLLAVLALDATAFEVGLINAASMLAFALIGLPAGAWLDRWRRRPVLVASDLVRAALLATIPVAALLGWLSVAQLVVVSFLVGLARVFFDIGYRSYLPAVIGKDQVLAGNSALEFVRASGQIAGPALGGLLVALVGAANVILVQVGTFAVSALTLLGIRAHEPALAAEVDRPRLHGQIVEGLRYVWTDRFLRATAFASAVSNLAFAVASAVTFIFMSRTLDLSPAAIGLVLAVGSGAVPVGAAIATRASHRFGAVRILWLSLAVATLAALVAALAQPGWGVALLVVGTAVGELVQIVYAIANVSLRQRLCPDRMLGRVNATMTVLIMGLFPVGALAGGVLGELIGARGTLLGAAGLSGLAPIALYAGLRGGRHVHDLPPGRPGQEDETGTRR